VPADPDRAWACVLHGALYVGPAWLVCLGTGYAWERLFAAARRRPRSEGLGATALLLVLTLPPAVPLWQVALGASFAIVVAKELFGGTGRNFVNPALAGRAFLYFAYPATMAGTAVWAAVDGWTAATPLTALSAGAPAPGAEIAGVTWKAAFLGAMPGSLGETSTLACLLGATVLLAARVASWRVMASMLLGAAATALGFNLIGSDTNPMFHLAPQWHVVLGGFAFGLVFMATDPVTAAQTNGGRWLYGFLVGFFCVVVRVLNPGFPESVMVVILLGNVFAPLLDWLVIEAGRRRRRLRHAGA